MEFLRPDRERAKLHLDYMILKESGHVFDGPGEQCQCGVVRDNWMRRMTNRRKALVLFVEAAMVPCRPCRYSEV